VERTKPKMHKIIQNIKRTIYNQINANKFRNERNAQEINNLKSEEYNEYFSFSPPGHFYSPIPSLDTSKTATVKINKNTLEAGVNFNDKIQKLHIEQFGKYYSENLLLGKSDKKLRYSKDNDQYGLCDATLLYSFIRHYKPKKIIEIGSGYSSAVMMDVNDKFFGNKINITFIEPYPTRLNEVMNSTDKKQYEIIEKR